MRARCALRTAERLARRQGKSRFSHQTKKESFGVPAVEQFYKVNSNNAERHFT